MSDKPEEQRDLAELRAKVEKELCALLAHPLVPVDFKCFFEDRN